VVLVIVISVMTIDSERRVKYDLFDVAVANVEDGIVVILTDRATGYIVPRITRGFPSNDVEVAMTSEPRRILYYGSRI